MEGRGEDLISYWVLLKLSEVKQGGYREGGKKMSVFIVILFKTLKTIPSKSD